MSLNIIILSIIWVINYIIVSIVNSKVDIYMDEEFHFDQTMRYSEGNMIYWNKKLTTFPGVFIISAIIYNAVSLFTRLQFVHFLRIFNSFNGTLIGIVSCLFGQYNTEINKILFQLIVVFLPINYFFNFLFYTDTYSNSIVYLFYYSQLNKYSKPTIFIIGLLSVFIRQNNIIWINLFLLSEVIDKLLVIIKDFRLIPRLITTIIDNKEIIILDLLFLGFIYWNNFSVVLGDKSNHNISFHLAQINHLLISILLFLPKMNFKILKLLDFKTYKIKNLLKLIIIFVIFYMIVLFFNSFSYTHEFILSDNRHYSFYYFKRIYENKVIRHVILIYISIIYSLFIRDNNIIKDRNIISWFICSLLILVPAKLFDFRYFNLPILTLLMIIHEKSAKWKDLYCYVINKFNLFIMISYNMITIYVFLNKPFNNSYFSEVSRFMW